MIEDRLSFGALVALLAAHRDMSAPLRELFRFRQTSEDVRVRHAALRTVMGEAAPKPPQASPVVAFPRTLGRTAPWCADLYIVFSLQ